MTRSTRNGNPPAPAQVEELSQQQLTVIAAIMSGLSQADAAHLAGVAGETVSRWKQQPAFIAELNRQKLDRYEATAAQIDVLTTKALNVIKELLDDYKPGVRLTAARLVLANRAAPGDLETDPRAIQARRMMDEIIKGI